MYTDKVLISIHRHIMGYPVVDNNNHPDPDHIKVAHPCTDIVVLLFPPPATYIGGKFAIVNGLIFVAVPKYTIRTTCPGDGIKLLSIVSISDKHGYVVSEIELPSNVLASK